MKQHRFIKSAIIMTLFAFIGVLINAGSVFANENNDIRRGAIEPSKIVWIGDSLTQGSLGGDNDNENNPWAPFRVMAAQLDIPVEGYGYYGLSTHDCLWSYTAPQHDGQTKDPDALYILWVGSCDFRDGGYGAVDGVINEITDFLVKGNISRYLIIGTTDREEIRYNGAYMAINSRFAGYYGDRYIDIIPYREFGPDDLHLTAKSYENIADAVRAKLVTMGEINGDSKPANPQTRFTDVEKDRWYSGMNGPISYVIANGIMSGTAEGVTFEPEEACDRAMFVQILYNMEGNPAEGYYNPFIDVPYGKWYSNAIIWAASNGITGGTTPTTFEPDLKVSRETVAQFLYNYARKCGFDTTVNGDLSVYSDYEDISRWAVDAISWASGNGIIGGYSDGRLAPKDDCTRAQIAQMIMNFRKKFGR